MRTSIRSRLRMIVLLCGGLGILVVASVQWKTHRFYQNLAKIDELDEVNAHFSEINQLARDLLKHGNERTRTQWYSLMDHIEAELAALEFINEDAEGHREHLVRTHTLIREAGDRVMSYEDPARVPEFHGDQLFLLASRAGDQVEVLFGILYQRMQQEELWTLIAVFVLTAALILSLMLSGFHVYRYIARPLLAIREGLRQTGQGNLDVKLPVYRDDEFGQLATDFNRELENLKKVTSSRDALEREIAQRKQAEADLERTVQKLESSNAELEQFAYVASHDLQQPLRMVSSFSELLMERYEDQFEGEAKTWLTFAADGAKRMQELIHDLLDYSRLNTRGSPFGTISLEACMARAELYLLEEMVSNEGRLTHDTLPELWGDENQITAVFQNLFSNALKFRSDEKPHIHVSAEQLGGMWQISVADNGKGIPEAFREKVFSIFQRLESGQEGTGIGLASVRRIVARHGGEIWVDANSGGGSIFRFTLAASMDSMNSTMSQTVVERKMDA